MNDHQPSCTRVPATRFGGPKGSSSHRAGMSSSPLVLWAVGGCWPLPDTGHRAPATVVWAVVTAPRRSHDCSAVSLLLSGSSRTPPVVSDREKSGEKLISEILATYFFAWESKVCHCEHSPHHGQQVKAKQAVPFHGPLPLSQRRLSVMRAKLPFNVI